MRDCLAEHEKPLLRGVRFPAIQGRRDHHGSSREYCDLRPSQVHDDWNDILKMRHHQNPSLDRLGADGTLGRGALAEPDTPVRVISPQGAKDPVDSDYIRG